MDDDDDDEYSRRIYSNEFIPSHRLTIRRNILRSFSTLRSAPYHTTSTNSRRREHSRTTSNTINNLTSNIEHENNENNNVSMNVTTLNYDQDHLQTIDEHFHHSPNEDFQILVDLSPTSQVDLTTNHDYSNELIDDVHFYNYPSTTMETIIPSTNSVNLIEYSDDHEYSPSINNNNNNNDDDEDDDSSIEIILESSQNNSHSSISRRRRQRSIISSNHSGLRLSDIVNIPQKLYSSFLQQFNEKSSSFNTQCVICLEDFQLNDSIKILHCQHIFHTTCINEWLRTHSNCAYCRTDVIIDMLQTTTVERRQRTHTRRNHIRTSTNNTIESSNRQRES